MNSKRRAELQRKLSLNAVPRPPAGLADRIKSDIPKYLEPAIERGRFASAGFNMRVAASLLLAVMTLVIAVYMADSSSANKEAAAVRPAVFPPSGGAVAQRQAVSSTMANEVVRLDTASDAAIPVPIAAMTPPPALPVRSETPREAAAAPMQQAESRLREEASYYAATAGVTGSRSRGVEGGAVTGEVSAMADRAEPQAAVAEHENAAAPAPAPPASVPVQAAAPEVARATVATETRRVRSERAAAALTGADAMAKTSAAARDEVFGISVDPGNFHRIRQTLESGGRPLPSAVDVEALVNYFAGQADRRPRRGVRLDVEASPAPIEKEGDHAVLRFSIDTAAGNGEPVASDVRMEISFNSQVVANFKRVGGNEPLPSEATLGAGTSVTGLYAMELRPNLHATHVVATVRLHYTSIGNSKPETETVHVRGRDLAKTWQRASRRHRLAALGALWGESLKSSSGGGDVARRAEELATQDPKDSLARELAAAASASADGSP